MTQYINQQDFNRATGTGTQYALRQATIIAFEALKAITQFIKSMFRMFMGKN